MKGLSLIVLMGVVCYLSTCTYSKSVLPVAEKEMDSDYWINKAKDFVNSKVSQNKNTGKAKNVIFFIGDGMSIATLSTTRLAAGMGEEGSLSFEKFPHVGMVKTYCVNSQVPDSACTATAYLTGVKNNRATIGVNAQVKKSDCEAELDTFLHTESIGSWAINAGKSSGLVTTTRVTHASPAGMFAHTAFRDWESDTDVKKDCPNNSVIQDIAMQMIYNPEAHNLKVIMGGGRKEFLPNTFCDCDDGTATGYRSDGRNLIEAWKNRSGQRSYVWNREQLLNINPNETDYVLGLFENDHMMYHLEAVDKKAEETEPTLAEMTKKAIEVLSKNENGFFLFVEGGKIDMAHHDNFARIALDETIELSKAVEVARQMLPDDDTLIVVSSDHSHVMTYSGYGERGADIHGISKADGYEYGDGMPWMILSYANGPGFYTHTKDGHRVDVTTLDTTPRDFRFPATLPRKSETHGGDDVAIFASGPYSHLFSGTFEQHTIPHLMAYASCIGHGLKSCDTDS